MEVVGGEMAIEKPGVGTIVIAVIVGGVAEVGMTVAVVAGGTEKGAGT